MRIGLFILLSTVAATAAAEPRSEVGLARLSTYSSHGDLLDPDGWSAHFRCDLSLRASFRLQLDRFSQEIRRVGFVPVSIDIPESLQVRERIELNTMVNILTAGIDYDVVRDDQTALSIGAGLGFAILEQDVTGWNSLLQYRGVDNRSSLEARVTFAVFRLGTTPFGLHLGCRVRHISSGPQRSAGYEPFRRAFTLSNVEAGLVWRF